MSYPIIVLDAGHGGKDFGASSNGFHEKDINLKLAFKLRTYLLANYKNVDVRMTRTNDDFISLEDRTKFANHVKADLFLSLHSNAFDGKARGYEDFIYENITSKNNRNKTIEKRTIFHGVVTNVLKKWSIKNRGRKKDKFQVLRDTNMSAILVETLFLDNEKDQAILKNVKFQDDMVEAYGKGIAKAIGLSKVVNAETERGLWIVQAGAFINKGNAEALGKELEEKGFKSYIYKK